MKRQIENCMSHWAAWVCLVLGCWLSPDALAAPAGSNEVRGVWMWSSNVVKEGAETIATRLAAHRINRVFLLVKGYSGAAHYESRLAPAAAPGKDPLKEMITACHPRGIQVHAWLVFNADNVWGRRHPGDAMYFAGKAGAWEAGPYSKKDDPEKIPICPLSPAYSAYFKSLIREVIDRYPVDGIHLDYIRYGHLGYCFCPRHQAAAAAHGIDLAAVRAAIYETLYAPAKQPNLYFERYRQGDTNITAWVKLRQAEIDNAVQDLRALVKRGRPSLAFSASFMPEGGETDDTFALCHYAQNYATAGAALDFILPMTYYSTPEDVARIALNAQKKSGRPVYSGLWACPPAAAAPAGDEAKAGRSNPAAQARQFRDTVQLLRQNGVNGFVLFRYGAMTDPMWKELQALATP